MASCIALASTNLGQVFTILEIMDATNKFDESLLLGIGGFGKVYKGTLEGGTKVAVKRGNLSKVWLSSTLRLRCYPSFGTYT